MSINKIGSWVNSQSWCHWEGNSRVQFGHNRLEILLDSQVCVSSRHLDAGIYSSKEKTRLDMKMLTFSPYRW